MASVGCNEVSAYHCIIDEQVKQEIMSRYPGATIKDVDFGESGLEVEILHNKRHKDVYFGHDNNWLRTR